MIDLKRLSLGIAFTITAGMEAAPLLSGIPKGGFDLGIRAQDDLFNHVNGAWIRDTPIPEDKSNYGSFVVLMDEAQENIRALIEEAAKGKHPRGSEAQKVGDFYTSYMNQAEVDRLGLEPLSGDIRAIDGIESFADLIRHFGHFSTLGIETPLGFFVDQDDKNSTRYLAALIQNGTTLPDRDYYLKEDEKYQQARGALKEYIVRIWTLAGWAGGGEAAAGILDLETRLAKIQWERTELRDAEKRYNKFQVCNLNQLTSEFPWSTFFKAAGVPDLTEVNVTTPSFFEGLATIFKETKVGEWKTYLRFHLVDACASALSEPFVQAHFELHGKVLTGVPQIEPRWKRAVDATSGSRGFGVLGDAVGKLYVDRYFTSESKQRMDGLVKNLLEAFGSSIDGLSWMTDVTKVKAKEKLGKITTKIGYTEKWRDYSQLEIRSEDLVGNLRRSAAVEYQRMIQKLGQPVDRSEWGMTPQTVNAYYNPSLNEIVFPAAILQPPFFNVNADDAVNYGGIGAVIGHEISHAFDDQGSRYDGDGNLQNWWTEEDRTAFTQLADRLVAQYEHYEALPGKRLNGRLTLGENIADLSGMAIAFKAYRRSLRGESSPVLDGWTGEQRFFLGWSQVWRRKYREAELVRRLVIDPHSPSEFRANGPVVNFDPFYEAFGIKPGDRLYRETSERIQIW